MTDWTPPQAPEAQQAFGAAPKSGPSGARAGFGYRLAASLIYGILIGAIITILAAVLEPDVVVTIALYTAGAIYYIVLEGGATGETLGKKAVGIRVIGLADGAPIGYGRATVRYFGRIVSSIPVFLGYFWMLWDGEKQTWHDKFATCVVVPA